MTRKATAAAAIAALLLLLLVDLGVSPPNPYAAPPLLALGSGAAQTGGFCAALPD